MSLVTADIPPVAIIGYRMLRIDTHTHNQANNGSDLALHISLLLHCSSPPHGSHAIKSSVTLRAGRCYVSRTTLLRLGIIRRCGATPRSDLLPRVPMRCTPSLPFLLHTAAAGSRLEAVIKQQEQGRGVLGSQGVTTSIFCCCESGGGSGSVGRQR